MISHGVKSKQKAINRLYGSHAAGIFLCAGKLWINYQLLLLAVLIQLGGVVIRTIGK